MGTRTKWPSYGRRRPCDAGVNAAADLVREDGNRLQPWRIFASLLVPEWHVGFSLPGGGGGGGGGNRAPKNCGGGFGKRAQLTGTINQSL